jgi:hypothetical protein
VQEDASAETVEEGSSAAAAARSALLKRLVKHSITPVDHLKMVGHRPRLSIAFSKRS